MIDNTAEEAEAEDIVEIIRQHADGPNKVKDNILLSNCLTQDNDTLKLI